MMGKGSNRRAPQVPASTIEDNWGRIFGSKNQVVKTREELLEAGYTAECEHVAYGAAEQFDTEAEMVERITGRPVGCEHDWCSDGDPGPGEIMTLTCSRCGKEQNAVPPGYTAEELEQDNPFNQWMLEK